MFSNKPPNNGGDKSAACVIDRTGSYYNIIKKLNPKNIMVKYRIQGEWEVAGQFNGPANLTPFKRWNNDAKINYHIFYQFLSSTTKTDREQYYLDDYQIQDFTILSQTGCFDRRDGMNDTSNERFLPYCTIKDRNRKLSSSELN